MNERYRVIGLLGRGGMGEVYKAEDLKLSQTVALKFLPEHFAEDKAARERFFGEVRTARQVSHPNVCRVFDIGEVEGSHFLSMEFIDGDDLSSLLRRIGRLPPDKAVEIARQLCAGLHAVHQAGILHRDFKPANVMIDGRGKARLTDFGIAGLESELKEGAIAGTPAYMSPEQITGKELTPKSDVYSLGLVLYEIFTGKQAFAGDTINELIRLHRTTTPTNPSEVIKDIDPLVEQVILKCLEKDPQKRPASALQVALALPGGDPLQAALAMGETPSPEMVAAAGEKTGLRPMIAVVCLTAVVAALIALAFVGRRVNLIEKIPFESSPEILAGKGREAIAQLGYPERPFDKAYGLDYDNEYLDYIKKNNPPDRWRQLQNGRGGAVYLWYRESPTHLQPFQSANFFFPWTVDDDDPPASLPGMIGVKLDTLGRLREFYAKVPQLNEATSGEASAPDWTRLFVLAGLDPSRFTPAEVLWNPESVFDVRVAWTGTAAEMPEIQLRVEAASYHGKIIFFKLIGPWTKPREAPQSSSILPAIIRVGIFLGAVLMAWRNYRRGKGDLQGALRLALFGFAGRMLFWLLTTSHVSTGAEQQLLSEGLSWALLLSLSVWVLYLAFEPYVRRRWPTSLITWSRVLAGRFTDPLVGRDLLVGIVVGLCFTLIVKLPPLIALEPATNVSLQVLLGVRFAVGDFIHSIGGAIIDPLALVFVLTLLRALLRRDWLAGSIPVLLMGLLAFLFGSSSFVVLVAIVIVSLLVLAFIRFGLLTMAASTLVFFWLNDLPFTTNFSAWYVGISLFEMFLVTAFAVYAFYTSLGGQKVFKRNLLED